MDLCVCLQKRKVVLGGSVELILCLSADDCSVALMLLTGSVLINTANNAR